MSKKILRKYFIKNIFLNYTTLTIHYTLSLFQDLEFLSKPMAIFSRVAVNTSCLATLYRICLVFLPPAGPCASEFSLCLLCWLSWPIWQLHVPPLIFTSSPCPSEHLRPVSRLFQQPHPWPFTTSPGASTVRQWHKLALMGECLFHQDPHCPGGHKQASSWGRLLSPATGLITCLSKRPFFSFPVSLL